GGRGCTQIALHNRADHSSSGRARQFLGTRFQPNEFARTIFHVARGRVLRANEFPQTRNSPCRQDHNGERTLPARNADGGGRLWSRRCAPRKRASPCRDFTRRGLRALGSGVRSVTPSAVRSEHALGQAGLSRCFAPTNESRAGTAWSGFWNGRSRGGGKRFRNSYAAARSAAFG